MRYIVTAAPLLIESLRRSVMLQHAAPSSLHTCKPQRGYRGFQTGAGRHSQTDRASVPGHAPGGIGSASSKLSRDIAVVPLDRCVISVFTAEEQHNVERHDSGASTSHSQRLRHTKRSYIC